MNERKCSLDSIKSEALYADFNWVKNINFDYQDELIDFGMEAPYKPESPKEEDYFRYTTSYLDKLAKTKKADAGKTLNLSDDIPGQDEPYDKDWDLVF